MLNPAFKEIMLPIWLAEAGMFVVGAVAGRYMSSDSLSIVENLSAIASLILFPAIAGLLLQKAHVGLRNAVLGAMSISLVSLACTFVIFRLEGSGWLQAFSGYVISVVVLALPAQALSGFLAASYAARKTRAK